MELKALQLGRIWLRVPPTWREWPRPTEVDDAPSVIADGVQPAGSMRVWGMLYQSGERPDPSPEDLIKMARDISRTFGPPDVRPYDDHAEAGPLRLAALSYRAEEEFFRVWCVSDGLNFAVLVYGCPWGVQAAELDICESIARSVRFDDGPDDGTFRPIRYR